MLRAWLNFQYYPSETMQDIQTQVLWMNSDIIIEGKPLLLDECINNELIFINDLLDFQEHFMSYQYFIKKTKKKC